MRRLLLLAALLSPLAAAAETTNAVNGIQYLDSSNRVISRSYGLDPSYVSTLVTATAMTQIIAAPAAGTSIYVTDISFGGDIANATATPATLTYGTGTNCATSPVVVWKAWHPALTTIVSNLSTPIKIPAAKALCYTDGVTGSKAITLTYFVAP